MSKKSIWTVVIVAIITFGIGVGVGPLLRGNLSIKLQKLDEDELKERFIGTKFYGWTSYTMKPFVLHFAENNQLIMQIGGGEYRGTYEIKDGLVYSSWDGKGDKPYISPSTKSRYNPNHPMFKDTMSGEFWTEYYLLEGVGRTRDTYIMKDPSSKTWGTPCFVYKKNDSTEEKR